MSEISESPDALRETADVLIAKAERCYRLAREILDLQVRGKLLELAREFETKSGSGKSTSPTLARTWGRRSPSLKNA